MSSNGRPMGALDPELKAAIERFVGKAQERFPEIRWAAYARSDGIHLQGQGPQALAYEFILAFSAPIVALKERGVQVDLMPDEIIQEP